MLDRIGCRLTKARFEKLATSWMLTADHKFAERLAPNRITRGHAFNASVTHNTLPVRQNVGNRAFVREC